MAATKSRVRAAHAQEVGVAAIAGLPGRFHRPIKLTFLGAGSFFCPRLVNDLIRIPRHQGGVIALVDIDAERLALTARLIRRLATQSPGKPWRVQVGVDREVALKDADYVVNSIEVSGADCVRWDYDIPLKYGVDQCIGDTAGPGGLFKALRTIPVWVDILRDCERLCPDAWVLNYTNPMAMMCLAAGRSSAMRTVGLCHSVQGTSHLLARYAGVPLDELEWDCAGINHLAWFTTLRHKGEDLYPRLRREFERDVARGVAEFDAGRAAHGPDDEPIPLRRHEDLIRKDMCVHFGAFITESSGHLSEYLPYYRKNGSGRKLLRIGYDGGSRFYATNWPKWRERNDAQRRALLGGREKMEWPRSWEYASWIIEAREKDAPFRLHGNVMNQVGGAGSLITNLPSDGCVEVACLADRNGVRPVRFGALPPQMAAISASNMGMFDLGAQAAMERSVEKAIHALALDPLTAAVCSLNQIKAMTLELFRVEKKFLPRYS